ncbi:MAG: hypothetical protein BWY72_02207 [Bacteroidetes bacterium ADurb.Bin416]|nr:MAG: hypothetical protein BWY72_02207 [Bacteroidetes bacterium ADurb.Bin416]
MGFGDPGKDEFILSLGYGVFLVWCGQIDIQGDGGRLAGCKADNNDGIGVRGQVFAFVGHTGYVILHAGYSRTDIQAAFVISVFGVGGEIQIEVAHALIGHTVIGLRHDFCRSQVLSFLVLALKHQASDFGQGLQGIGTGIVVGRSGPNGFFVELNAIGHRSGKNHGAHTAVADGQGCIPVGGGLIIPQGQIVGVSKRTEQQGESLGTGNGQDFFCEKSHCN